MATCKYYLQGNCRFGQYCRFAHTTNVVNYGDNSTLGNKQTSLKTVASAVAEEILAVERGGQWPLSCFGPFKERPCIPGMEDFSPDEFHWEIYRAQKSGTVDQTKLQFQQLCQTMKSKRDLLKNPTPEIAVMLESLQKGGQENSFGGNNNNSAKSTSNFSFATPQMTAAGTSAPSTSNLFASKPFNTVNTSNPFVGTTSAFGSAGSTPFGFSGASNAGINSPFGAKSTFGANPIFGNAAAAPTAASPFGSTAVKNAASPFTGTNQNAASFGPTTTQTVSAFNAPPPFGQQSIPFSTSSQESTPFGRTPLSTQSNTIFGGGTTTSTNSVFGGTASNQLAAGSIFGGNQSASAPLFGASTQQNSGSIFGGSASAGGNPPAGTVQISPFSQTKTNAGFGVAPVFGGAPSFGAQSNPGIFGAQSTFGAVPIPSSNVFGGTNSTPPTFGTIGQSAAPGAGFNSVVKSPSTNFGATQNSTTPLSPPPPPPPPFGSQISTANAGPFGSAVSTANLPFVSSAGPFNTTTVGSTPFSGSNVFVGTTSQSVNTITAFGTTQTQPGTTFGGSNTADNNPLFNQASPFAAVANSPFTNAGTNVTTSTSNPFGTQPQTVDGSPFGGTGLSNQGSVFASSQATPFGNSPFASVHKELDVSDESVYTIEGHLTDDEKAMYLAEQFVLGKIPLKPPTKELG